MGPTPTGSTRSYLYVPGNSEQKLSRAEQRDADAVIFDLEDAVPWAEKDRARDLVRRVLTVAGHDGRPQRWIRINQPPLLAKDIAATAVPGVHGVMVPKAEPDLLAQVDTYLTEAEHRHHLPAGTFTVIALIETAGGVLAAPAVATSPRVVRLGLGEADLAGELALQLDPERAELAPIRLQVVLASAAAGLAHPIGPVETALHDEATLRRSTELLSRLGFRARTAIHPAQVPVINDVFTPTPSEVAWARVVVDALMEATTRGSGVAVGPDHKMIDLAVARSAEEILSRTRETDSRL
jgi:citrate lyase subunit beta/citryl-CoA lyase